MIIKKGICVVLYCVLAMLFSSCVFDLIHIKQIPTQLESSHLSKTPFILEKDVNVSLRTGYSRKLKQGTKWNYVGTISYGDVYKTNDQILTVKASNIYEAYIVVSCDKLVGFYLPVGQSFPTISNTQKLEMSKINFNR